MPRRIRGGSMKRSGRFGSRLRKSDEVRSAFALATAEAQRLGSPYFGTEHVLMGIARLPDSRGAAMLARLGADPETIVREAERAAERPAPVTNPLPFGRSRNDPARLPGTAGVVRTIEAVEAEVEAVGAPEVGSDFVIVGLLVEGRGVAATVLTRAGVTLERARADLDARYGERLSRELSASPPGRPLAPRGGRPRQSLSAAAATSSRVTDELRKAVGRLNDEARHVERPASRSGFEMTIDERSDLSIYEQIIARVQEAIATGSLKPGDRLPAVRHLADSLDIAPGTVARAYAELESRRIVVTDGARGTRVAEQDRSSLSGDARRATLIELLRPVAVEAFHLGASTTELHDALDAAAGDIFPERGVAPTP